MESTPMPDVESMKATPLSSFSKPLQPESLMQELSPKEQRRVLFKIDVRVCLVLGLINCINVMDRANLGLAAVAGALTMLIDLVYSMNKDLQLEQGDRYRIVALIFFIPYLIFELPSTVLARKFGARPLLMSMCTLWGALTIGTGFLKSWGELLCLRTLLGLSESLYYPAVVFLLSSWYTRYELQKRYAMLILITVVITSFSGVGVILFDALIWLLTSQILTFGFLQMEGVGNLRGWRWTWIMEGILTVLLGLIIGFLVVDFPDKARNSFKFLTNDQIDWVMQRLREDRDDVDEEDFTWKKFFSGGRHFTVWLFAVMQCCCATILSSVSFFLPIILKKDMGFDKGKAICLSSPPYLFALIPMCVSAWLGDKYRIRGPILIFNSLVVVIGLVLLGWANPSSVRYLSIFMINSGILSNIPTVLTYQANNIRGQWVRAFSSATLVIGGGLGGVFGACLFEDGSSSASRTGVSICIALNFFIILSTLGLMTFFGRQNQLAKQGRKVIFDHPGFLYSL